MDKIIYNLLCISKIYYFRLFRTETTLKEILPSCMNVQNYSVLQVIQFGVRRAKKEGIVDFRVGCFKLVEDNVCGHGPG